MGANREKKKGGKRLNKVQLTELIGSFFSTHPNETFSIKQVFEQLKRTTHPLKRLAMDTMEEMALDDVLARITDYSYRLADNTYRLTGTFHAKSNGKNSFIED